MLSFVHPLDELKVAGELLAMGRDTTVECGVSPPVMDQKDVLAAETEAETEKTSTSTSQQRKRQKTK